MEQKQSVSKEKGNFLCEMRLDNVQSDDKNQDGESNEDGNNHKLEFEIRGDDVHINGTELKEDISIRIYLILK